MTHKILTSPFFVNFVLSHNSKKYDYAEAMHDLHLSTDLKDVQADNDPRYRGCKKRSRNAVLKPFNHESIHEARLTFR